MVFSTRLAETRVEKLKSWGMSRDIALKQLGDLIEEIQQNAISRGIAIEGDEVKEGVEGWKDGGMEGKSILSV
jgi:hypothetical protein